MKPIKKASKAHFFSLLIIAMGIISCKGLDDWTDMEEAGLFSKKNTLETTAVFKRYGEPGMSSRPIVVFIVDESNVLSTNYNYQIQKACDYTKLPFYSMNIKSWNSMLKIAPTTRVISLYDTRKLNDASIAVLLDFVSNGGTLFIPFANEDHRMAFLYGFKPNAEFDTDAESKGWLFSTPMLPNLKGKTYMPNLKYYGFSAQNFSNKVKILACSINNPNFPSVVENKIGTGRVLLYNTSSDFIKSDRGFLFAGILKGLEGIPYPIANVSTIFLDDFPAPLYDIKAEPIASEMNLTMSNFVKNVWWPDMSKLAEEYKIPYTSMVTFDYRNKVLPPFTLDQWNENKITKKNSIECLSDWLVRDVARKGNELAFHGYNHVSLVTDLWKKQEFIGIALNTVTKKWGVSDFGKMPTSYVPPSNIIDKKGLIELKKAMPSLKYMCSLFLGKTTEGGNREFDYDPYHNDFFDYPRISSGFYMSDDNIFNQQSMYLFTGIWTHFVHPDDVFQISGLLKTSEDDFDLRNNLNYGWYRTKGSNKAMLSEFKIYLKQMTTTFPQMRFVTANNGAKIVIDWRASRYSHKSENGIYTVKEINTEESGKHYWFMYGSSENAPKIEKQLRNQAAQFSKTPLMDGYLYSINSKNKMLSVVDLKYKTETQLAIQLRTNQMVQSNFNHYVLAVTKFKSNANWVDDSAQKLKLELIALKNRMENETKIDSVIWNKYAKNLSWENRGEEVWKMLEEYVLKFPIKENIMYSKELDRVIGYPNDLCKEKWMNAQLLVSPNDIDLLNSYVANFYTDENQLKIKKALKALLLVDTSFNSYKNYIRHLLQYQPEEARNEISDIKPDEQLAEFATAIVWLFADNNEFQKAYDWSAYSTEIDFVTKMNWLIELKQFPLLEVEFLKYAASNPEDVKAKFLMCSVYHELGRFKDSWVLTNSLPESPEKEELQKMLNKDVIYENNALQLDLMANYTALFNPTVQQSLLKENRLAKGSFMDLASSLETNQAEKSVLKNVFSYSRFDKKSNIHSFSATFSQYYKREIKENYSSNFDNSLFGLQYKFKTAELEEKPQYWSKARIEIDKLSHLYYQFGIGISASKGKKYQSAECILFPVETAPALNEKMYQIRLNLYQDFYWFKSINTSISIESNYYSNGLLSRDTIQTSPIVNPDRFSKKIVTAIDTDTYEIATYDDALDGAITLKMMLDNGVVKKYKWVPYLEGQYSLGSRDQGNGFPYWMIKERLYGGLGLGWEFGITDFHAKVEAGYFLDDYSKNFQRFTGNVAYQLFDFTALTLNMELFSQSKYYSNSFQLGIKYNLKKKIKTK